MKRMLFKSRTDTMPLLRRWITANFTLRWYPKSGLTEMPRNSSTTPRKNCLSIQMISESLHRQIFPNAVAFNADQQEILNKIESHLDSHGLLHKETSFVKEVVLSLPKLVGNNLDEHFKKIAQQQSQFYHDLACKLATCSLPAMPKEWKREAGWTRYFPDGRTESVAAPLENLIVFDVEVCLRSGNYPILATAASDKAWYCWIHPVLTDATLEPDKNVDMTPDDCIPLQDSQSQAKLVIGHNVCFDRSYIKEQYYLEAPLTKFLDTLSLHMCISGLSGSQRALLQKAIKSGVMKEEWMDVGSLNSLADVFALYTGRGKLNKTMRDIFVEGTVEDIIEKFQESVFYCAGDVIATHEAFSHIWPLFLDTASHPVTFAGMLEMATAYLPVDRSWVKYVNDANETFDNLEDEMKNILMKLATQACELTNGRRFENDPWLWSLDWSIQDLKVKKNIKTKKKTVEEQEEIKETVHKLETCSVEEARVMDITNWYPDLPSPTDVFHKTRQHMSGFPSWFRKFCRKYNDPDWEAGPVLISAQARIAPLLLRMTWDGYPLFYNERYGWGYLVPGRKDNAGTTIKLPRLKHRKPKEYDTSSNGTDNGISGRTKDVQRLIFPSSSFSRFENGKAYDLAEGFQSEPFPVHLQSDDWINEMEAQEINKKPHEGLGPFNSINLPGVWFYKIPHKDGDENNCGNPLGKDYLSKMEENILVSLAGTRGKRTLELNKMISFWRNASKRICSQMTVWHKPSDLPTTIKNEGDQDQENRYGVILPRMKVAGTVTRRAVEETWLTASNPRLDCVGSELKSMIRAPPGYVFVGADVDSQELWIAAILGDAHFAGVHGCTAFGWMNLQGKKTDGTDLHSKTANTIGISRDHAKIFNYGRIYGAGKNFAKSLLLQFSNRMSEEEAENKAEQLYLTTKGHVRYRLTETGLKLADKYDICVDADHCVNQSDFFSIIKRRRMKRSEQWTVGEKVWHGGSESEMFNKLEKIALSDDPRTPVLGCKISRALRPNAVGSAFMTSRINWVVQSSAVDYLHLMLVCMKWLFTKYNIRGRFSISIHDEVRYLVEEKDKYRAALALQITNLLTRSLFAFKLGLNDLPQSVAFFSAVDIDKVVRKEVNLDCKTPSNPEGLAKGYGIGSGEALDIYEIIENTNGGNLETNNLS